MAKIKIPNDMTWKTGHFSLLRMLRFMSRQLPRNISNLEYIEQVIGSSGSVGSNYIEANESLSKKDFIVRIKICRKEAKESAYWLRLIIETNDEKYKHEGRKLLDEALELKKIFSSILLKSE